ncbi:hypothetical protein AVEN_110059-1 [Araneus ventricosus]|uniref:STPR domain-containing protein n=1 Tax=Araneus ventricosus TaxID=182803 RepID=A0A4Y2L1Y7_ARAVE|nr:hypothetical protein AVEN_110059-1 [Araneus ventricosus]
MLPVDSRQLENVKEKLLKLTKKETMAQRSLDRGVEETEQNNRRLSVMAQRGQDRKAKETEEKINSRLSDMAQRGHERRTEETEGQRNSRLSAMVQHARECRLNVIEGQNHQQIQTFYAARTVRYSLFRRECWVCVSLPHFFSPPGNDALFDIARVTPGHLCM